MRTGNKTLTQLESVDWGSPPEDGTYLIRTVTTLRNKPIKDFTVEDLRIVIGQNVGLPYLMPLAIACLKENLAAEGMYFPGDLLCNVLSASPAYFAAYPLVRAEVEKLAEGILVTARTLDEVSQAAFCEATEEALAKFRLRIAQ